MTLVIAGLCIVPAFQIHRLNIATVKQPFASIRFTHRHIGRWAFTMLERPRKFILKYNKILYLF